MLDEFDGVGVDDCDAEFGFMSEETTPGWGEGDVRGALSFVGGIIEDHGDGCGGSRQETVDVDVC